MIRRGGLGLRSNGARQELATLGCRGYIEFVEDPHSLQAKAKQGWARQPKTWNAELYLQQTLPCNSRSEGDSTQPWANGP